MITSLKITLSCWKYLCQIQSSTKCKTKEVDDIHCVLVGCRLWYLSITWIIQLCATQQLCLCISQHIIFKHALGHNIASSNTFIWKHKWNYLVIYFFLTGNVNEIAKEQF